MRLLTRCALIIRCQCVWSTWRVSVSLITRQPGHTIHQTTSTCQLANPRWQIPESWNGKRVPCRTVWTVICLDEEETERVQYSIPPPENIICDLWTRDLRNRISLWLSVFCWSLDWNRPTFNVSGVIKFTIFLWQYFYGHRCPTLTFDPMTLKVSSVSCGPGNELLC